MNPLFQSLMGGLNPAANQMMNQPTPMMNGPFGAMQGIMGRVQQLAGAFQNPQQMVQQFFPDAPAEVSGNPDRLLQWMQQTGKTNPQMINIARQILGR